MRLLFDENLSPSLVHALDDTFPASTHVRDQRLEAAEDVAVWTFARDNGFVIVSKDEDFHQRAFLFGAPPKVVWVRLGNCSTREIEAALRSAAAALRAFADDPASAFLILHRPRR